MGQKPNGHSTPTLDAKIASALNSDHVDKSSLIALLDEATEAIAAAEEVVAIQSANALDLANADPDAIDELVRKAERTVARLEKAIPRLRGRIQAIEQYEYSQAWSAKADELQQERDFLAAEFAEIYPGVIEQLRDLYHQIDANTAAIDALHGQAPYGENRRLLDAELTARGIDRYDAAHPRLRDNLKIPEFIRASVIAFPPDPMATGNQYAAQAHAAFAQRLAEKDAFTTGPDWASGRDLALEQQRAEQAKRAVELKAAEAESKRKYEEGLKHGR